MGKKKKDSWFKIDSLERKYYAAAANTFSPSLVQ